MQPIDFENRVRFISELARRLHEYGTSAPRLEKAIDNVSGRLDLVCNSLATPTSIIMSFAALSDGPNALPRSTQVIRVEPGDINLRRLAEVDAIAEQVYAGTLGIESGLAALRAVRSGLSRRAEFMRVFSFGISSAAVAVLFKGALADAVLAGGLGLMIGLMTSLVIRVPAFGPPFEAVAAFVAMFAASLIAAMVAPVNVNTVVVAAIIVLLPGLALTTAVVELSTQHLVAGSVRLMGAGAVLLKLSFGTVAGVQLAQVLHLKSLPIMAMPLPEWTEWVALIAGSYAFAVLFQAARRDYLLVMASSWLGYLCARVGATLNGPEFGVFLSGVVVGSVANLYARLSNRPGAIVRLPGIILLVPGSVGFRTLFYVFERDVYLGLDKAFSLIVILISLVAGLLFGSLLIPPRRSI
jgi:uncharacterized membrane protein YjjP (DUF1212 family)